MVCRYIAAKSFASQPEPALAMTSFSGSWLRTRKNFSLYVAFTRAANASMRLSCSPLAPLAQVEPYAIFQFSSSTRGLAASRVIAISALVGNGSSPLLYVGKIVAVRPLSFSQSMSAWSRGALVKPPAAPPHSTPQDGTSRASVTQSFDGGVVTTGGAGGVVVSTGAGGVVTSTGAGVSTGSS